MFVLLNPTQWEKQWDYRERIAHVTKRYGWTARFGEIDRRNPFCLEHLLRQAWEEDCARVAVLGGDGTLHRVINTLHKQKRLKQVELAVLPGGTCNDFARMQGLNRKNLDEALRLACTGHAQPTDLGLMDSEVFINTAGIGRRPTSSKEQTQPLATLKNFRPIPLKAAWEKGTLEGTFYMMLVCNGYYFSGGLHFSKKPVVDDGCLDIYFLPVMPKWKLAYLLLLGRMGRFVRPKQMVTLQVQRIEIQAQSDLWPQADGEPPGKPVRRVVFSISPEKAMIVRSW